MTHEELMRRAVALATENVRDGGGPFGAVIARGGEIVAEGVNRVTARHDPTAHAEVQAIRAAAGRLGTHVLAGCDIYASCEPCPMCLGAIYWARLDRLFYAATKGDAAAAGFDDAFIYKELELRPEERRLVCGRLLAEAGDGPFEAWRENEERCEY